MDTVTATAYFLTCCRPSYRYHPSFCYYIDLPKLINLNSYQENTLQINNANCNINHEKLEDHNLKPHNTCNDIRAWSLDEDQRRKHFIDISSKGIEECDLSKTEKQEPKAEEGIQKEQKVIEKPKDVESEKQLKKVESEKQLKKVESDKQLKKAESEKKITKVELKKDSKPKRPVGDAIDFDLTPVKEKSSEKLLAAAPRPSSEYFLGQSTQPKDDSAEVLTDETFEKLNCNLANLEATFDKFVSKNRDFIQRLSECLNFEKQKQAELENCYNDLKRENDILRASNDYLKKVNCKQVELFKKELNEASVENKIGFTKKIQRLESIIRHDKDELQHYKKNEQIMSRTIEKEKCEMEKIKNEVCNLKNKQCKLLKSYLKVFKFLEDMKETLDNTCMESRGTHNQKSSNTISDSGVQLDLNDVLKKALYEGIETLNIRDLSVLHDFTQNITECLCHQNEFCGKNPMNNMTISHLSMFYAQENEDEQTADESYSRIHLFESTSSNLSMFPSRQKPEPRQCYNS